MTGDLKRLARQLGYAFEEPRLLQQALTHRSYGTPHNERLEFLGDSVLSLAISTRLFHDFPRLTEGELSRVRAHLVKESTLAEIAQSLSLGDYLFLGEGELKSGGFRRPSILADALEAIVGAIYLDGGFSEAQRVLHALYAPVIARLDPHTLSKDPKTRLQEFLQGRKLRLPKYTIVATEGEAHEQRFRVECYIPELDIRVLGEGSSRRKAEQEAARLAYETVQGGRVRG
ncbi:ribonuclease III [Thiobacter aerophilum]|uniref:ribonuclease III n=1 Tax=Thiobacter aerophilum TaxID=3121275 RepID=UPI003D3005EF